MHRIIIIAAFAATLMAPAVARGQEDHRPHHIAVATGYAQHSGKGSGYLGIDYVYTFQSNFTLGAFFEDVRGGFDVQAFGVDFGKKFSSGAKFSLGPGVETKLKSGENLWLFRTKVGYDWNRDRWSFGPTVSYDFIEDASNTWYLGVAVGYEF
jgi:hypothetical protein